MRRQLKFLVILALLALLGGQTAVGQAPDCAEFKVTVLGNGCERSFPTQEVEFGGDKQLVLVAENSWGETHRVMFSWGLYELPNPTQRAAGKTGFSWVAFYEKRGFSGHSGRATNSSFWLEPRGLDVRTLVPGEVCGTAWCDTPSSTSKKLLLTLEVEAASAEVLRALPVPVVAIATMPALATISAKVDGTAVTVSWTTVIAPNGVVRIYRSGSDSPWSQLPAGSATDWGVPIGTHQYCIRGVNADWTETGNLACVSVEVKQ